MSRTFIRWLLPVAVLAAPAGLLQVYFGGNWYAFTDPYSLGMTLGILAYGYLVPVLILAARIPLFDRLYGHDRVLTFHSLLAGLALACGIAHSRIKEHYLGDASLQAKIGEAAMITFLAVAVLSHLFMAGHLTRWFPFTARFIARIRKIGLFDYSRVKLFHNLTAAAVIAIIVHIQLAVPTKALPMRSRVMAAWGAIGILCWVYHKIIRLLILSRHKLTLSGVEDVAPGVMRLAVSGPGLSSRVRRAGQFGYLRILDRTCGREEHPFTVSSDPVDPALAVTVKDLGNYTARLRNLQPGARVLWDGPYGLFSPVRNERPWLFVAGGIGITPFLSIISQWDREGMEQPVILIWSVRSEKEFSVGLDFKDIAGRHAAFTYLPVVSNGNDGRQVDYELLARELGRLGPEAGAWMCGPESLRRAVTRHLKKLGMPGLRIHYERFAS